MPGPPAAQRRKTNLDGRTQLLERETELEQIGVGLHGAAAGSGAIVVIEGAAGIGKSSLLGAAAELAEAERMTVLSARRNVGARVRAGRCDPAPRAANRAAHGPRA